MYVGSRYTLHPHLESGSHQSTAYVLPPHTEQRGAADGLGRAGGGPRAPPVVLHTDFDAVRTAALPALAGTN